MDKIEPGHYYQLGQRTFWLLTLERIGPALLILIIAFTFRGAVGSEIFADYYQIFNIIGTFLLFISVVVFIFAWVISSLEYRTTRIMVDDSSFHVVRGIISKEEVSMPYRRIQSVEIKQSLLFRILGLGRVIISTTTDLEQPTSDDERNNEVIKIVDYKLAKLLEKTLIGRAEIERMEVKK